MKKDSILVTGGTGFIGKNLVNALNNMGFSVTVLTRNVKKNTSLECNVISYDDLDSVSPQNIVIHLATNYGRVKNGINDLVESNLFLAIKIFEKALKWNSELIINTDTYYSKITGSHTFENYILSKKQLRDWLIVWFSKHTTVANMRLEHVFGSNDNKDKFCKKVISNCVCNATVMDLSQCTQKRDFIFIDDVVSAYISILENRNDLVGFNEFEVGTGKMHTLKDFAETCKKLTKSKIKFNYGAVEMQNNDLTSSQANNKGLLKLGWKSVYSMEQGLRKILGKGVG